MSRENVEIARRSVMTWRKDRALDWSLAHDDMEVQDHLIDMGEYRGRAGVERWLNNWRTAWSTYEIEPEEFIEAGDRVVVVLRITAKGRGSGITIDRQDALVYELRDKKIARLDRHSSRSQALKAVGLAE